VALWTNEGLNDKINYLLGGAVAYNLVLRLYVNAITVGVTTVAGDLTECTLPSYSAVPLIPSTWVITVAGGVAQAAYPTVTFTFGSYSGTVVIYGYWVTNTVTGRSAFVEGFAFPYTVPNSGGALTVQLTTLDSNPF
jgi:hypothetical protein